MVFSLFIIIFVGILLGWHSKFRKRVPILMYHRIADVPGERNSLPAGKFIEQLDYLKLHGYNTITLSELYNHFVHKAPLPPHPVILTFDDGYEDNCRVALPLLQERRMKATVFPIANWVGRENKWESFKHRPTRTMNWDELRVWQAAGMEIGSHTLEHPFLTQCDETRLQEELVESKKILENKLSTNIDFLCYPYGYFDDKTLIMAQQAGYKGALAIFEKTPVWRQEWFALPRIPVSSRQPLWEFALKVGRFHILFIILRKLERSMKGLLRK
ncbi:polysaccharide deacetylase family protein [Sporomusa aerivorans]|uniref:polysaccharide deacetylase family protein n=1 Tax=Sporomusa aerivorans TaxID=204936 RepID=UPI00352B19E6